MRATNENPPSNRALEEIVGFLTYPMCVATAHAGNQRAGRLVGFAPQISISPPCFLVGLSSRNRSCLVPRRHEYTARSSEKSTGDDIDKFLPGEWRLGFFGLPILKGAAAWFVGRVLDEKVEMDDHVAVLHEPETSRAPGEIVTFADVRGLDPGYDA